MSELNSQWQCYQEAEFLFTQALSSELSFAIITAHNPKGQILSASQNRLLDRRLQFEIQQLHRPYRAMIGASADRCHMEKSWAVSIDKASAIRLGCQFNQNAIYFVEHDKLQLIPCLLSKTKQQEEVVIGPFSPRVRLVNELPDFD
ncbi:DUF3293 domain-containing protein [Shewanella canadensis]|uniref:DUF3293 domain-containing protein n=1 Tax=Shewanella canadensis TaxID=271096 RepID=A0A3S0J9H7_9GAMM|nr:DUF3293 domain-containing protein [Shewanella canadensis]RTR40714.1 DUF3293 domain-containing protein [Shewanella canadensis]